MILSFILFLIFTFLGMLHLSWVCGSTFGFEASLPTKENGEKLFIPKKVETAIVGFGLLSFALFYLFISNIISFELPDWMTTYVVWIIPAIFILRSIGEFKYVGFFKKIKHTQFGQLDSKFYAPLCLWVGASGFVIAYIQ